MPGHALGQTQDLAYIQVLWPLYMPYQICKCKHSWREFDRVTCEMVPSWRRLKWKKKAWNFILACVLDFKDFTELDVTRFCSELI